MANNPFDPQIIQVKKTLDRGGMAGANRGFGSVRATPLSSRPAPGPQSLDELDDVDLATVEPTDGQVLIYNATTGLWEPGDQSGGGGGGDAVVLPLDVPPTTPHAKDDEFTDPTLDAKWVKGFKSWTETLEESWLTMDPGGTGHAHMMRQVAPTGSFTVMAKVSSPLGISLTDIRPGLFVARTATSKALVWGMGLSGGPAKAMWIEHNNYSEVADWGAYNGSWSSNIGGALGAAMAMWYRMIWDSGTGIVTMAYSVNGVRWYTATTRSGWLQPDRIGLVIENNTGNTNAAEEFCVDWFRVTEP